ncbi:unnamed protein product, partial [marine sediment metagenome]
CNEYHATEDCTKFKMELHGQKYMLVEVKTVAHSGPELTLGDFPALPTRLG